MNPGSHPAPTYESLAKALDFHVLRPELSDRDVAEACRIAREYQVASIVVRPSDIDNAVRWMGISPVPVASVAGWPDGCSLTGTKLYEARDLLRRGARQIDFVLSAGKLVSREFQHVEVELLQVATSCREAGARLHVVVRNEWLSDDVKFVAIKIAKRVRADAITVTPHAGDFALFAPLLKDRIAMKAVAAESLDDALACRDAGCTRIGSGRVEAILDAWKARLRTLESPAEPAPTTPLS